MTVYKGRLTTIIKWDNFLAVSWIIECNVLKTVYKRQSIKCSLNLELFQI